MSPIDRSRPLTMPAARAPRVAAVAREPQGQMGVALPAGEAVRVWFDAQQAAIPKAKPAQLAAMVEAGNGWLAKPNLDARAKARVHLVISGAAGQLAALGESQISNGKAAFRHVEAAFTAAPAYDVATVAYGRTIAAFCDLSWAKRKGVEVGVGISVSNQAARTARALAAFPQDAIAQLTRRQLAEFNKDNATIREVDAALAKLPQARVEAARRELSVDAGYAAKAKS